MCRWPGRTSITRVNPGSSRVSPYQFTSTIVGWATLRGATKAGSLTPKAFGARDGTNDKENGSRNVLASSSRRRWPRLSSDHDSTIFGGHRPPLQKKPSSEKIVSLSLADRAVEFFQHRHHVFPNFAFLTGRLVPQQIRWVIRDHEWRVVIGMPFAT